MLCTYKRKQRKPTTDMESKQTNKTKQHSRAFQNVYYDKHQRTLVRAISFLSHRAKKKNATHIAMTKEMKNRNENEMIPVIKCLHLIGFRSSSFSKNYPQRSCSPAVADIGHITRCGVNLGGVGKILTIYYILITYII